MKFLLLQSFRLASQATSLYTREAHYRPTVRLKGVTHYTLQGKACEKGQRRKISVLFAVGANCVRPRAFTERPYEDDFLSVGKTCFMEGTPCTISFLLPKQAGEKRCANGCWYIKL